MDPDATYTGASRPSFRHVSLQPLFLCTIILHALQAKRSRQPNVVRAAMFDDLSRSLDKAWDMVRKDGKLSKDNIKEPMREIRRALLEADVSMLQL